MTKYLIKRLLRGLFSVVVVVAIVMVLVFSLINREDIFKMDAQITKKQDNLRVEYKYTCWENYGYLDYVPYADYLKDLLKDGKITEETYAEAVQFGATPEEDSPVTAQYVEQFRAEYEKKGYTITRLNANYSNPKTKALKNGGAQKLFAARDIPIYKRIWNFFTGIITIDNIHYTERKLDEKVENPGIRFTFFDPVYNTKEDGSVVKEKFSPAIIGNGTRYKYLLYFDNQFPFIHQNLIKIKLGLSYSINTGVDVWDTMTQTQGTKNSREVIYPTGKVDKTDVDLHTAEYKALSSYSSGKIPSFDQARYTDLYSKTSTQKLAMSKIGYSFVIGICEVICAYFIGIPVGLLMARKKDKLVDKIGTIYIIFIIAVPSLAYIFMFRAIGELMHLPTVFDVDSKSLLIYVLPIASLALPAIGGLMKWIRRYTIDQENSDYVKFARSGGLTESEIFRKHILKNAIIPIVHGIPAGVLGSLVGAIITERVYTVPGAGGMLTNAITLYDNAAIIGLTLFYSMLSIISLILGDILMAMMDPRISFSDKGR